MSKEKRKRDQRRKRDRRRERATRSAEEVREPEAAAGEEEPAMSLEEFRQLRDEFFEGIPARIDALKRELVEEMAPSDAFDL